LQRGGRASGGRFIERGAQVGGLFRRGGVTGRATPFPIPRTRTRRVVNGRRQLAGAAAAAGQAGGWPVTATGREGRRHAHREGSVRRQPQASPSAVENKLISPRFPFSFLSNFDTHSSALSLAHRKDQVCKLVSDGTVQCQ